MRLSDLQHYTLIQCYQSQAKLLPRRVIDRYYQKAARAPKKSMIQGIITKSIERLIDKELLIGYGRRTPHKWFIEQLKLTPKGRRLAKTLMGEQQQLPLTRRRHANSRKG